MPAPHPTLPAHGGKCAFEGGVPPVRHALLFEIKLSSVLLLFQRVRLGSTSTETPWLAKKHREKHMALVGKQIVGFPRVVSPFALWWRITPTANLV